jgi:hypothetical protein
MRTFLLVLLFAIEMWFAVPALAENANLIATNQAPGAVARTNETTRPSDAELQTAAREVWHKIIVFAVAGLVGAVVVAGFACYGAYRKFGGTGVVIVGVIIALGVIALGGLLLLV